MRRYQKYFDLDSLVSHDIGFLFNCVSPIKEIRKNREDP